MATYREQSPSAAIAQWVECGWYLESAVAVYGHRVPPDGCLDIVYDRLNGLRVIGTMTVEQRFDLTENASMTGIRFRPGMARLFLGLSPAVLTDGSAKLEDLWRNRERELKQQLDDAPSIRDAMRILLGSLRPPASALNPVQQVIGAITAAHGNINLDSAAEHANLSSRQFRRRCLEESGLTPKLLCRVLRFRHACRIAHAKQRPDWSAIALEAQYFDQSHFIADFHEFTGLTPMAVFSNTP